MDVLVKAGENGRQKIKFSSPQHQKDQNNGQDS